MKTNRSFLFPFLIVLVLGLSLSACKKDKQNDPSGDSASMQQLSKDELQMEVASDEALNDVEVMLSGGSTKSTMLWPCNATIDSTGVNNDTITFYITYDGKNCLGNLERHGKVEVKKRVGEHWVDPGATVIVKLINFKVTVVYTGKSVTLNGTKTFVNVSGGHIWQLWINLTSVVHRVHGSVQATFDDNTTRIWNVARQRTFTLENHKLVMTIDGFGTEGEYSNLVIWGTNRMGENFYTQITQSVVHKQRCNMDPVSGIKIHRIPSMEKSATITFGYNDNNEPIQGDECPTRFRVDWVKGSHSGTIYLELH